MQKATNIAEYKELIKDMTLFSQTQHEKEEQG